jgi:hypothetical protein
MPTHIFGDKENNSFELVPDGDYEFEVVKCDFEISAASDTNGSEVMKLSLSLSGKPGTNIMDKLTFHPKWDWKVDTFMKCCGMKAQKGDQIEFTEQTVLGLRGIAKICVKGYKKRDGSQGTANNVACFYTDKQKLPKRSIQIPAPVSVADDDEIPF